MNDLAWILVQNAQNLEDFEGLEDLDNLKQAYQLFMRAAKKGYATSAVNLAALYSQGIGVALSYQNAFFWLEIASLLGQKNLQKSKAKFAYHLSQSDIDDVERNARAWFQQFKKARLLNARLFNSGVFDESTFDAELKNLTDAIRTEAQLARDATTMIFKCFNKAGVKPRGARPLGALSPALLSLAITSLAILSSPSFAQSSYQLARDVSASIAYPQGDIAKALPLWQKRAQKNDIRAMVALGHIHLKGFDVAQDYELARGWYQRAARQNDAEALFALGLIYDNGLGVKKNKDIAISLYQKAAAQNYAAAQNNLALALLSGKSQPHLYQRHKAQALNLYRLAALNGLAQARMNLGLNLRRMTLGDKQQKRALEWIKLAAYQGLGSSAGLFRLSGSLWDWSGERYDRS